MHDKYKHVYQTTTLLMYLHPMEWKQPPHVHFANLQLTPASLIAFSERYGLLYQQLEQPIVSATYVLNRPDVERMQSYLRRAWSGDDDALVVIEGKATGRPDDPVTTPIAVEWSWGTKDAPIIAIAKDLWSFIRLAFLQDYSNGRVKICPNPDCPTPYFLQTHGKQQYCSRRCAVAASVERYRQRERAERKKGR